MVKRGINQARLFAVGFTICGLLSFASCEQRIDEPKRLNYEVVATYPHDNTASTQGLLLHDGVYYESTGGYNVSTLRKVDPETGRVLKLRDLPAKAFGEGLALLDDRLFQLEWKGGEGYIYDRESFERLGKFQYAGEGWGLAWDGTHFILSDGTPVLRFLEPDSFSLDHTVKVRNHLGPVDSLNELEFIEGKLYANRWHHDEILVIDPVSGSVEATLNLAALERPRPRDPEAVLNGIAYDPDSGFLHVTGKSWPRVYVLRVKE